MVERWSVQPGERIGGGGEGECEVREACYPWAVPEAQVHEGEGGVRDWSDDSGGSRLSAGLSRVLKTSSSGVRDCRVKCVSKDTASDPRRKDFEAHRELYPIVVSRQTCLEEPSALNGRLWPQNRFQRSMMCIPMRLHILENKVFSQRSLLNVLIPLSTVGLFAH